MKSNRADMNHPALSLTSLKNWLRVVPLQGLYKTA
ncbi:hypothetical protein SAMN04489724_1444 [Algoriphagus locisalis]|uniref:Uncharacterized protein n=1 Tax=Algoriphagus locisalis TaxID=305507 RepID=A0A1I6ZSV7_9BACT|nr:hypothetical protein SAMN04489724_1444 [Algoriphagus locisalis]